MQSPPSQERGEKMSFLKINSVLNFVFLFGYLDIKSFFNFEVQRTSNAHFSIILEFLVRFIGFQTA